MICMFIWPDPNTDFDQSEHVILEKDLLEAHFSLELLIFCSRQKIRFFSFRFPG